MPRRQPPAQKTLRSKKKPASRQNRTVKETQNSRFAYAGHLFHDFMSRRPHRSFRLTRRRDYVRSLDLPGYIAFTSYTWKTIWAHKKTFSLLVATFTLLNVLLVGIASQSVYHQLSDTLQKTSGGFFSGAWGEFSKAGLLLLAGASGDFTSSSSTDSQKIYGAFLVLFLWLTTVWLLRGFLAGQKPRLRDALYNAGAPIISTGLLALLFVVQCIPLAIVAVGVAALQSADLFTGGGLLPMLLSIVAVLLSVLSLYFITSTFFAMIVVTLPGMYPWRALRTAGDLVRGRRLRLLLRILWITVLSVLVWAIVMLVVILLDTWITSWWSGFAAVPIVPVMLPLSASVAFIVVTSYIYLLYRKVVEDESSPA